MYPKFSRSRIIGHHICRRLRWYTHIFNSRKNIELVFIQVESTVRALYLIPELAWFIMINTGDVDTVRILLCSVPNNRARPSSPEVNSYGNKNAFP